MPNPRFMIAAPASGSGKTMLTCGILAALKARGISATSFKCGPDYIDPMFHRQVLRTNARNLDPFFTDRQMTRYLFARAARQGQVSVLEGVMGYYDGLGGTEVRASSYELAAMTETPVILVVNARGMSLSALALIQGFLGYRKDSRIAGVILNQMSPMLYPRMKKAIEEELSLPVFGFVPRAEEMRLKSRHLGLVLPEEVEQLEERLKRLGALLEETVDLDGILELSDQAPEIPEEMPDDLHRLLVSPKAQKCEKYAPVIAVARDEAFCFLYEDNLNLLRELGARLIFFSPLKDEKVPDEAEGLLLCGGYPELYAKELEENVSMRESVRKRVSEGLPFLAECGGFLYLHRELADMEGKPHQMAGVIPARAYPTSKLSRFGYVNLTCKQASVLGFGTGALRGHEFHYFESESCGEDYEAVKPATGRAWSCIHATNHSLAGFPHLYYYSNPAFILEFLQSCVEYGGRQR